jgi:hypothetical protein
MDRPSRTKSHPAGSLSSSQPCAGRRVADENKLIAKIQVTEQYLAKCPKWLHFPLYKSNYSKTPFLSTLLIVNLVKFGPENVYKNEVIKNAVI